jgi:two-component system sensor histidine kinase YesM
MFGYITPDKPDLKIKEFEVFRGYYCGVCRAIAKRAGHRGRFILSYDTAFLALLLDSLNSSPVSGKPGRCPVHPLKKRFIVNYSDVLEFSSDINILLAYYNLKDKWQDERKLFSPIGLFSLRRGYKRVKKKHPDLVRDIEKGLSALNELDSLRTLANNTHYFSIAISPKDAFSHYGIELVYFIFSADVFYNIYTDSANMPDQEIVILDNHGKLFSVTDKTIKYGFTAKELWQKGAFSDTSGYFMEKVDGQDMIVSYCKSTSGKWVYIHFNNYQNIRNELITYLGILIISALVFICIFMILTSVMTKKLMKPICILTSQMQLVKQGDYTIRTNLGGNYETRELSNTFNSMLEHTQKLIQEIKDSEYKRRHAEIAALQAQINPHFLLNTLNTIKLHAVLNDCPDNELAKMLESFMNIIEGTMCNSNSITTIRKELEYVTSYIYLMTMRLSTKIHFEKNIDPNILEYGILKALLQPIVENAILHGIMGKGGTGTIKITGKLLETGDIEFCVSDNGIGMTNEEIDSMLSGRYIGKKGLSNMGLSNVIQRINLNYGNEYGLRISSEHMKGTSVYITIPGFRSDDYMDATGVYMMEETDEKNNNC